MTTEIANAFSLMVGVVILWAGFVKLRHRWQFVATVKTWWPMSARSARFIGTVLPWVEVAVGVSLAASITAAGLRFPARSAAATLLGAFVTAQVVMLASRHKATCGCFSASSTVSAGSVMRAGGLVSLTLVALAVG